jgi:hypothetical protein
MYNSMLYFRPVPSTPRELSPLDPKNASAIVIFLKKGKTILSLIKIIHITIFILILIMNIFFILNFFIK